MMPPCCFWRLYLPLRAGLAVAPNCHRSARLQRCGCVPCLHHEVYCMTFSVQSGTPSVIRRTLVVGAVVSAVGLVLSSSLFPHPSQAQQPPTTLGVPAAPNAPTLVKGLPDFTELLDRVGPSVLSIP